jgi:hypothetical protein
MQASVPRFPIRDQIAIEKKRERKKLSAVFMRHISKAGYCRGPQSLHT